MDIKKDGGWAFISHSHKDIKIVRKIRNRMEAQGFEPLMFYLKCLNDDNEIEELIKREIDERKWFIYVDSENSRKSKWVQTEREYIAKQKGKQIIYINLDDKIESQVEDAENRMKVFVSYSRKDEELAKIIIDTLVEKEFLVFDDGSASTPGSSWVEQITQAIDEACQGGYIIALITENVLKSKWCQMEIDYVFRMRGKIIPIIVGDGLSYEELHRTEIGRLIELYRQIRLPSDFTKEDLKPLLRAMGYEE